MSYNYGRPYIELDNCEAVSMDRLKRYSRLPLDRRSLHCLTTLWNADFKSGAAKSGVYVKDKSVAGATYLKEKDWTKEKQMAGKAGQATKS